MNGNVELLNYIHQDSEMGQDTIKQLVSISEDEEYKKMLQSQLEEYKMIYDTTDEKIKELNRQAKNAKNIFNDLVNRTYLCTV